MRGHASQTVHAQKPIYSKLPVKTTQRYLRHYATLSPQKPGNRSHVRKIRHARGQARYYSPTGTLKQRDLNQ